MKQMRNFIHSPILMIFVCFPPTTVCNDPTGITNHDPEENMNARELIRYHGYPVKEYTVTTEDGYKLIVQRIPHGKNNSDSSTKRMPVLFMPGMLATSTCWIVDLPNKSLPFLLANRRYDVWLGNYRGNSYGRQHTSLDPNRNEFWKFSMDELGIHDLPAIIDFILTKTGSDQLHYIGHSMGTTGAFILLSERTDYNKKLRTYHAFSPLVRLDHTKNLGIRLFGNFADLVPLVEFLIGYEYLPNSPAIELLTKSICKWPVTNDFCLINIFIAFGFDEEQFNKTRLPVYVHSYPAGTSWRVVQHYGQIFKNRRFAWYDYTDPRKNLEIYNAAIPPLHDLSKITAPVYLYYGDNDWIVQPKDVAYVSDHLPKESLKQIYRVPFDKWNHIDFLSARDVNSLLYDKVIKNLKAVDEMKENLKKKILHYYNP